MRDRVCVGVITGAHGVKGEVKLRSFTADPAAVASYRPLQTATGAMIEIVKLRPQTDGFIAVLKGVADRDAAEAFKGTELFVARQRLPEPEAGEIYLGDLIGLAVISGGAKLGKVIAIQNYGAGDLLDVKVDERKVTVLIPFAKDFVVEVDAAARRIIVELPEGFLDEEDRPSPRA